MNQPKKLYRSRNDRMITGVCGGLADYLNMDATLVRLLTVVLSLVTGVGLLAYLVAIFVIPEEPPTEQFDPYHDAVGNGGYTGAQSPFMAPGSQTGQSQDFTAGGQSFAPAPPPQAAPPATSDPIWGPAGAPWESETGNADPASGKTEEDR